MANVTTPYAIADGNTLAPDQYNDNLYDPSVAGRGLLSEPNGGLDANNLAGGFKVQAEHILPGELHRSQLAYATDPVDYFDDGSSVENEALATAPTNFVPVFGAACRIYVPYRSLLLWQWSVFVHPWRVLIDDIDGGNGTSTLEGFITVFVGGSEVAHTRRRLTFSVFISNGATATYVNFNRREDRACQHYGQHHAELVTTTGYREMQVRLFLEKSDTVLLLRRNFPSVGDIDHDHTIHTRASFGIRSCWAVGYHVPG